MRRWRVSVFPRLDVETWFVKRWGEVSAHEVVSDDDEVACRPSVDLQILGSGGVFEKLL